jgi:uracil-DNA glycosylase
VFELLQAYRGDGAFNQYLESNLELEKLDGPAIRRRNLRRYLCEFADASYLLVGEAAGYAGCRFSGIPFTGEAQIVGQGSLPWARGLGFEQSSRDEPWRERSGQIVWETLGERHDCVLWNAFPWHPHGGKPLSNRKPRRSELRQCTEVLTCFLTLFPNAQVCAIGRVSEGKLKELGIDAPYIRHPSQGGKPQFVKGIAALPRQDLG